MNSPARFRPRFDIWLLATASVLLLAQASFHLLAYPKLDEGLRDLASLSVQMPLPDFDVLRGAWILYAVHLLIAALLCAACAVAPRLFGRGLRIALAAWLGLDTVLLLYFVGPFLGSVLMAISAFAVALTALLPARGDESSGRE